jgi:hypothetical protein
MIAQQCYIAVKTLHHKSITHIQHTMLSPLERRVQGYGMSRLT